MQFNFSHVRVQLNINIDLDIYRLSWLRHEKCRLWYKSNRIFRAVRPELVPSKNSVAYLYL